MGYNVELDKVIWQSDRSAEGLVVKVMQYGNKGIPKVAFMRQFEGHDGEIKEKSGGRLDLKDVTFFGQFWPTINKVMKNAAASIAGLELPYPDEIDPDKVLSENGISVYDNKE